MSCKHRFYDNLIPQLSPIKFLIIGTFNPSWDAPNNNNAEYFYGRSTNLFWCICPHAFNDNCLIDKGKNDWIEFCHKHNIGLTDIIRNIINADKENKDHTQLLTFGFEDKNLDKKKDNNYFFDIEFTTELIKQFISDKQIELKGVFFTRKTHNDIPRIWEQWQEVKRHCDKLGIYNSELPTPSSRGGGIRDKIFTWRNEVQKCL